MISVRLARQMAQNLGMSNVAIFLGTINVMNVRLCMMVLLMEL